ncbi:ABC transporter permease [Aneurinibacillus aneurinilyticus]|uniref:ABC-2 type transporter n=1 Tax=Aneurinibacillus aneurinilyticus ATCC 12856 TaxID=649747 RepID=U1YBQ4_ANEAE|nr:ABC transporter permease [Aneurinibacillus aneurinilyticus]ERI09537.1 ABC-2 type transporter [Aneurinibacillus aneurinilyticus ATCC 12856]MCI1695730.1 ABC transporter permease [Aneurinibacillus aneurinilyticus]MED0706704.1 ABC transporter permease [Aneurinibacillus aneurinilyticus]MED0722578.1 ABC transporter permease [Aneurinibacillus aneurinilyticus]MED0734248.1 ABC transporter permease [Aneurinibacillus aneurinilyticus]
MHNVWTVVRFTLRTKMMTKSFIVTTIILALIISLGVNLPYIISLFSNNESASIGLVPGKFTSIEKSLEQHFMKQEKTDFKIVPYPNASEVELNKEVEAGKLDGYLTLEEEKVGAFPKIVYHGKEELGMGEEAALTNAFTLIKTEWLVKDSLTAEQMAELSQPVSVDSKLIAKAGETKEKNPVSIIVVMVLIILFFMSNMMTSNMIAAEVTQEKSSRIMEILITSVSPLAQMFGKIIGMFLLGLFQIAVFLAVIIVNLLLPHNTLPLKSLNFDFSMIDWSVVGGGLILYVLGYFLYATLSAAVGSIVSRTEDLSQAIMPITMLSMAAFYIAIFSVSTPNSMLVKVSSYIPFFTPTTMLLRIGAGNPAWWEFWIGGLIMLVSIVFFGWLSAKIYRTGVLMYGKRPSLKEIRKAMRAYKI